MRPNQQNVYEQYAINDFPCHFYCLEAVDKYNRKIENFCASLSPCANDLTFFQKILRKIYIWYLDIQDAMLSNG